MSIFREQRFWNGRSFEDRKRSRNWDVFFSRGTDGDRVGKTSVHAEKYFPNRFISTPNPILFTIFGLIWIQTDVRLVPNQSENGKYNRISGWFNKISKRFLYIISLWQDGCIARQTASCKVIARQDGQLQFFLSVH